MNMRPPDREDTKIDLVHNGMHLSSDYPAHSFAMLFAEFIAEGNYEYDYNTMQTGTTSWSEVDDPQLHGEDGPEILTTNQLFILFEKWVKEKYPSFVSASTPSPGEQELAKEEYKPVLLLVDAIENEFSYLDKINRTEFGDGAHCTLKKIIDDCMPSVKSFLAGYRASTGKAEGVELWVNNNIQGEFEPVGKTEKDVIDYFKDCFKDGNELHPDVETLDVFVKVGEVYVEEKDGVAIGIKYKKS